MAGLNETELIISAPAPLIPRKKEVNLEDSFKNLVNISRELEQSAENQNSASESTSSGSYDETAKIPKENILESTPHLEPLKSVVSPEYVRRVIRELETMSSDMMKQALTAIKVSTTGTKSQLRKRVAHYYQKENMLLTRKSENINSDKTYKYFDFLVAIDFECTCVEIIFDYPHEIIEFPAVLIDVKEMKIINVFRTYVRPVRNPILSEFCKDFTKISQETVDRAPYFREALDQFMEWLRSFGLGENGYRFAFVTDGPHDLWKFLQFQCMLSGIKMPHIFRSFINIKKIFKDRYHGIAKGNGKSGIENMLEKFDLQFEGNKHSGLDDAKNIAFICLEMMKRKIELRINQRCVYKPNRLVLQEDEEDAVQDQRDIDATRHDFHMWMRHLPMKLQIVTRRDFLAESYKDCDTCDELNDDDEQDDSDDQMELRKELEQSLNEKYEKMERAYGKKVVVKPLEPQEPLILDASSCSDSYSDEIEDIHTIASSTEQDTDFEMKTIWRGDEDDYGEDIETSSSESTEASDLEERNRFQPPINSLCSKNSGGYSNNFPYF